RHKRMGRKRALDTAGSTRLFPFCGARARATRRIRPAAAARPGPAGQRHGRTEQPCKQQDRCHHYRLTVAISPMESHPLEFEKPILELQRRLQDLKDHSDRHDLDFDSEVEAMETKIRETRRQIYDNLTAWQRVQLARHIKRPFALDYVARCFTTWIGLP